MSSKNGVLCSIEKIDNEIDKELCKKIEQYIINNMFPPAFHRASSTLTKAIEENRFEIYIGFRIKEK